MIRVMNESRAVGRGLQWHLFVEINYSGKVLVMLDSCSHLRKVVWKINSLVQNLHFSPRKLGALALM